MGSIEKGALGDSDIPVEPTSSIGAIAWPPIEATEQRKKGIYPTIVDTTSSFLGVIEQFANFQFDEHITRYSGRIFVTEEVFRQSTSSQENFVSTYLEGIIPLKDCGVKSLADCLLVYFGKNHPIRQTDPQLMKSELEIARSIFYSPLTSEGQTSESDFRFEFVTDKMREDSDLHRQYYELYSAFGWDKNDVVKLIMNPANILAAAFQGEELISAGMGELGQLTLVRWGLPIINFRMCEITEAATREEYRGQGLYTMIGQLLMQKLAQTDVNLIYAESNLLAPPVLKTAYRQGRKSVLETFEQYGYSPRPLEQHVRISGGQSDRRAPEQRNDLLVTYMSRGELLKKYERI